MYKEELNDQPLRRFQRVNEIINEYGKSRSALIPILQAVQAEFRYLPEEMLSFIATAMGLSPATVYGVSTFYAQFSTEPKGKHLIQICDGTACHVRGSMSIIKLIRDSLKLPVGKITTPDLSVTLETVACIGACALSPAMMVDGKIYGQLTPDSATIILDELLKDERSAHHA